MAASLLSLPRAATGASIAPRSRGVVSSSSSERLSLWQHQRRQCRFNHGEPRHRHLLRPQQQQRRQQQRLFFSAAALPPSSSNSSNNEGDEVVQETLAEMIRLQVGAEEVKEFVEKESDKLRESAEKLKAEADALAERRLTEADQGFDAALDDINRMADELAEELAASRAALEADKASARDFEVATARARSSATFFQNLYEAEPEEEDDDRSGADSEASASSSSGSDSDGGGSSRRGRARGGSSSSSSSLPSSSSSSFSNSNATSAIREAALSSGPAPPGRSPVRFGVWSVAAIALIGAAVADLFSVAPQITGDLSALATGSLLGYGAWLESKLLDAEAEERGTKEEE